MLVLSSEFDPSANALYLTFSDADVWYTVEILGMTLADVDQNGRLVGLEVLHPDRPWPIDEVISRYARDSVDARELRGALTAYERLSRAAA